MRLVPAPDRGRACATNAREAGADPAAVPCLGEPDRWSLEPLVALLARHRRLYSKLQPEELPVPSAGPQQFFVGAAFHDLSVFEDQDEIGSGDGAQAVGNDDGRASLYQVGQSVQNQGFG